MWTVLFNASLKSYKNPLGRHALFLLGYSLLFSVFAFFIDYLCSFFMNGNFFIASMINLVLSPLGLQFIAPPLINILLECFLPLTLLIYLFLFKDRFLEKVDYIIEVNNDTILMKTEDCPEFEVDKKMLLYNYRFPLYIMIFIQLMLFRFIVYPKFYPLIFNAVLIVLGILIFVFSLLGMLVLRIFIVNGLIQRLFYSAGNDEVLTIFEFALKNEPIIIETEQLTPLVEEFILMDVFQTSKTVKKNIFPDAKKARIVVNEEYLLLYEKYKKKHKEEEIEFTNKRS